ncbi:MAG: type II secretion system minor pseudopilin GspK [Rhodanobacteraceae bacterium]
MKPLPRSQRGVALLIALLAVALATMLIAGLLDRGELTLARTRNALRGEQAQAYAQALESYAVEALIKDDVGEDSRTDVWANPLPPQQVPGGILVGSLSDLNGCFNLNNLADGADSAAWLGLFRRLLTNLGVDPAIADDAKSWIGTDDNVDGFYLAQPVPYRSAQRAFAHVSELRLVRGVTSDVYARVAPYVCALPAGTKLNVNTASVPVLMALGPNITRAQAERVWQDGRAQYDGSFLSQWSNEGVVPDASLTLACCLGVASSYFLARGDVRLDDVPFTFFSVIERVQGSNRVIQRSRGSDDALVAPVSEPGRR